MQSPIQAYLEDLHRRLAGDDRGALANYIPELTKADPDWFGICLVTMDGQLYSVSDSRQPFTIQSISKAFVYGMALADRGVEFVASRVGVEPSGDAFNSISLHPQTGAPLNPMINAGAIATTSLIAGDTPEAQWRRIESSIATFVGHPLRVDEEVYRSESATGFRNRAIAWMLKNFGIIDGEPMASLENYFRQCSIQITCEDLGYMAATLANGGVHPLTGERALSPEHVEHVLSVMATCGMYDYAGSWLYEVGIPAKSGVGGGIVAVLPGRFGIAIFSPRLDEKGNSVRGIEACKHLSRDFNLHVFSPGSDPRRTLSRVYTAADAPSRRVTRGELRACLNAQAHRIKVLCLHGMLAVDGVEYVIRQMQAMAADSNSFILDMSQVDGLSESAARLLNKARLRLAEEGIAVVVSRIRPDVRVLERMRRAAANGDRGVLSFEDNDLAAEWCENRLLGKSALALEAPVALSDMHLLRGMSREVVDRVDREAGVRTFSRGEQIVCIGQTDDRRMFFIESGRVSVVVPKNGQRHQRIGSLGPGMNFGEMVLLGQTTRSATVYADTDVRCRILDVDLFSAIGDELPEFRVTLLQNLAGDLAEKVRRATQCISVLA